MTDDKNVVYKILSRAVKFYQGDIKTVPNFIIAFCLFYWVINLPEKHNKVINKLSVSTFSVYIIHQVPVFHPFLWTNIFMAEKWLPEHNVLYAIFVTITVFLVCSIIDIPRRKWLEPIFAKTKLFNFAADKINKLYY